MIPYQANLQDSLGSVEDTKIKQVKKVVILLSRFNDELKLLPKLLVNPTCVNPASEYKLFEFHFSCT